MSYGITEAILDTVAAYGPVEDCPDGILVNTVQEQTEADPALILQVARLLRLDGALELYDDMPNTFDSTTRGGNLARQLSGVRQRENAAWSTVTRREAARCNEDCPKCSCRS